jgi:putative FmdB family regulatory protein
MPMYEYRCEECGNRYEELRRMSEADQDLSCPKCGSSGVERLLSAFATGGCTPTAGGGFT